MASWDWNNKSKKKCGWPAPKILWPTKGEVLGWSKWSLEFSSSSGLKDAKKDHYTLGDSFKVSLQGTLMPWPTAICFCQSSAFGFLFFFFFFFFLSFFFGGGGRSWHSGLLLSLSAVKGWRGNPFSSMQVSMLQNQSHNMSNPTCGCFGVRDNGAWLHFIAGWGVVYEQASGVKGVVLIDLLPTIQAILNHLQEFSRIIYRANANFVLIV